MTYVDWCLITLSVAVLFMVFLCAVIMDGIQRVMRKQRDIDEAIYRLRKQYERGPW